MVNVRTGLLDAAFGTPHGALGRLGGALMSWVNAGQEREAVARARLGVGDRVLVLGHGPGVGVGLAAEVVGEHGAIIGVDPSALMRARAAQRCGHLIANQRVQLVEGTAERTGVDSHSIDAAISVNNVMLWDRARAFPEVLRVLRPGGRLTISVHRHVLDVTAEQLCQLVVTAGFTDVTLDIRHRRGQSPAVELAAHAPTHRRPAEASGQY